MAIYLISGAIIALGTKLGQLELLAIDLDRNRCCKGNIQALVLDDYHNLPGALAFVNVPGARFSNEYPRGALVAGGLAPVLAPGFLKGHALATPVAAAGLDNVFVGTAAVGLTVALVGLIFA